MKWVSDGIVIRNAHVATALRCAVRDVKIQQHQFTGRLDRVSVTVDGEGLWVTPGLIDLQINGYGGHEFIEGDSVVALAQEHLPQYGITSFLPTVGSQPLEKYRPSALRGVVERAKKRKGAEVLGWHLEGPFLNPNQCGIHRCSCILDHLDEPFWNELFRTQSIALMTLAPEMPFAESLLKILAANRISAAIGHSMATDSDLFMAKKQGVHFVTHLFNAMLPFHHRCPGIVGAVLGESAFGCTLISDLYHVYPEAIQIACKCNPDRLALVSDGSPLLGAKEKRGIFLGNTVQVNGERVLTIHSEGLAGSLLALDEQMRRFMMVTKSHFSVASRAASTVPASFIYAGVKKGKIAVGYDADCVLWEKVDTSPQVVATICKGEVAFARENFWSRVVYG